MSSFTPDQNILAYRTSPPISLKYLSQANEICLTYGYHDFEEMDPIFEDLYDNPKFKAIVQNAQDKAAKLRAQVKEM